jgi:hypothetical protein
MVQLHMLYQLGLLHRAKPGRAGSLIPLLRHQHVDDLPELIDRVVQGDLPTGELDLGLVDEPAIARASVGMAGLRRCARA